ncbi:uncharacterized protein LOC120262160 [Dioscorea cayenensis subsp. rotundata]|uniref:Uncharacterized protein LOC120262160 n=1 Tax=Dioscorea cayennensis subsp. rotundata TaxID=55577 RepID=A0AB40BHV4_DIOCR|nr:uncharacterized protein LOC120262160 [Dioscorea cayenensis subsp. rotundata]
MERQFLSLKQGSLSVEEYEAEFDRLSQFASTLVSDESSRSRRFIDGLKTYIRWAIRSTRATARTLERISLPGVAQGILEESIGHSLIADPRAHHQVIEVGELMVVLHRLFSVLLVGGAIHRRSVAVQQVHVISVTVGTTLLLSVLKVRLGPRKAIGLVVHLLSSPDRLRGHDTRALQPDPSRVPRGVGQGRHLWQTNLLSLPVQQAVVGQLLRGEDQVYYRGVSRSCIFCFLSVSL